MGEGRRLGVLRGAVAKRDECTFTISFQEKALGNRQYSNVTVVNQWRKRRKHPGKEQTEKSGLVVEMWREKRDPGSDARGKYKRGIHRKSRRKLEGSDEIKIEIEFEAGQSQRKIEGRAPEKEGQEKALTSVPIHLEVSARL
ncbi:unnamed protein product [Allacma fusca]|uniref:Uncharacterized protein n=1 Tax=Allacma fusca TaxID=39272 RepID=A0A8J2KUC9_9HEXA|nr:unnamed protein product [Allacma fusca]